MTAITEKAELQALHRRGDQVTDESLESTRRMLTLCEESNDAGIRTLVALDEQGSQLDRIETDLDDIGAGMNEVDKELSGMEKWLGVCACNCFRKTSAYNKESVYWKQKAVDSPVDAQPHHVTDQRNGTSGGQQTGGHIQKITGDAREDEMDDNMGQVSSMIGNLRNMALDMGQEVTAQNKQIDRINLKAESNQLRIEEANKRTQKLLE